MKKIFTLLIVLTFLLGGRAPAHAQLRAPYSKSVTDVMDFSGYSVDWQGSDINWAGDAHYIAGVTENGQTRSFASKLDNLYYLSVGRGDNATGNWQIGQSGWSEGSNHPENSYLQTKVENATLHIHNLKIGDNVKINLLDGTCTMRENNTTIAQGSTCSGTFEFQVTDNTINEGRVTLVFPGQYTGVQRIEIETTEPHFNYDPGFEVYDFFQIGGGGSDAFDNNYSASNDAGFTLNGQSAKYLSLAQSSGLSLNNRIAVCQESGWTFRRGIRAPGYSDGNSQWYNVSICNLRAGDRVEIFYTGDAPTFSSQGQSGSYTGNNGFKDVKNDGQFDSDEGDQMFSAGMALEGVSSRNEGNLSQDEGTTVLLYKSFACVMAEDGHLDLGLKNGNHTRILKVKIYSDHQATMVDEDIAGTHSTRAFFDITGELEAKEHIIPGGLEVRIGNNDPDQNAIVVTSKRGPVSYVNAVDGYKLPGVTKENGIIKQNDNLENEVPTTGTFYKFIPLKSGTMKVRFNASSMNYYRYDLAGNAIFHNDDIIVGEDYGGWLAEFDRANEWTLDLACPYYVKVSTDDGATCSAADATWDGGSSSGSGGGSSSGSDINLSNGGILYLDQIGSNNSDVVTFHLTRNNSYTSSDMGGLSPSTANDYDNPVEVFPVPPTGEGQPLSWDVQYTVGEIISIANGTSGVKLCKCYNATVSVTLPSSGGSGSGGSGSQSYGNGNDGEFELHVEAGKTYFFYGGWNGSGAIGNNPNQPNNAACGVAELLDVTFTPDKDIHPLAKWVESGKVNDDDLADVIGYESSELTIKKMSDNITGCEPYIDGDKLKIRNITYKDGENPGGVILIKVGDKTNVDDPVYAYTIAYDAEYNSTSDVEESQRGHTWDFSTNSLRGLEWKEPYTAKGAVVKDYGTYYQDYFGGNLSENTGSLLHDEMEYYVNGVRRSDWMFNYRLIIGNNNYDPRFLNKYDIEGDNADMMWDTEGLVFLTSSNQSCMFNEYKGTNIHSDSQTTDPDRYIGVLPGGKFIIPHLNADDRVIIYMGSGVGNGFERMVFNITNALDADHKKITATDEYVAGGSVWNASNGDPYYRGCYHFYAEADGDMQFELTSGSMCKIYKIQIYHGNRIYTNNITDKNNGGFLIASKEGDAAGQEKTWKLSYLGKNQAMADGTGKNSQENEMIAYTGKISSTDIISNAADTTITYTSTVGDAGTFRVRAKDMEQNMNYVADFADHNITVAYQKALTSPRTWDFTDIEGFSSQSVDDEWSTNETAAANDSLLNLSLWDADGKMRLDSKGSASDNSNSIFLANSDNGNQLWADGGLIPETEGLWFYMDDNAPANNGKMQITSEGLALEAGDNGWCYKMVVPDVPAGGAVYLRMTPGSADVKNYKFGTGAFAEIADNTNCRYYEANDNSGDYIVAIKNTGSKANLTLALGGMVLKKLAISEYSKTVNKLGYASESRAAEIDPELMGYMTGTGLKAYYVNSVTYGEEPGSIPTITLSAVPSSNVVASATHQDHNAYIIYNTDDAVNDSKAVGALDNGFHLFVPDMHDATTADAPQKSALDVSNNSLCSWLTGGRIQQTYGDYTVYLMNSKGYNPATGEIVEGVERFFKASSTATLGANKAYLQLLTAKVEPSSSTGDSSNAKVVFAIVFVDEELGTVTTSLNGVDSTVNVPGDDTYYTLSGVKIVRPTKSGIYIKNGKKVFVK